MSIVVLLLISPAARIASSMSSNSQMMPSKRPLVIAHRGSSGVLPEHTVEAYERAVSDGADVIECDVTLSQDLVPVCLHEELLQTTTDVADRPEFADRQRSIDIPIDGRLVDKFTCCRQEARSATCRYCFYSRANFWVIRPAGRHVALIKVSTYEQDTDIVFLTYFNDCDHS